MYRNSVETNVVGGITLNGFLSQVYPHTLLPSYCSQHLTILCEPARNMWGDSKQFVLCSRFPEPEICELVSVGLHDTAGATEELGTPDIYWIPR